jgi:hypothetical protein
MIPAFWVAMTLDNLSAWLLPITHLLMLGIVWQDPILFIYEVNKKNHVCDWCVLGLLLFPLFNYNIIQGDFNMKVFSFCETKSLLVCRLSLGGESV